LERQTRLELANLSRISGFDASIFTAIAVLENLVGQVKSGQFTGTIGKPAKTAIMGFSFGSYATHGAIATVPDLADAVVLTAVGFNSTGLDAGGLVKSFEPRLANLQNPSLFGSFDNGYLTWVDKFAYIWNYFKQPNFDSATADFVEAAKAPFAVTEFLTLLSGPMDASNFTGPVLVSDC
jgi:pimeloyl-ACP methyl ester carboxylesterase